jgi:hypothetical protein
MTNSGDDWDGLAMIGWPMMIGRDDCERLITIGCGEAEAAGLLMVGCDGEAVGCPMIIGCGEAAAA